MMLDRIGLIIAALFVGSVVIFLLPIIDDVMNAESGTTFQILLAVGVLAGVISFIRKQKKKSD
ncbi:Uncharacterised protein [BD1-7 clade bacterium]|uniref:Uncharacterized protein n=1 Tax=BD1-7 clade bacterium TaxID=2029982 RepID=A0A5S9NQC0_9GAMM|nr:Uncharacterised protein [BD1-7 clade bacterium]